MNGTKDDKNHGTDLLEPSQWVDVWEVVVVVMVILPHTHTTTATLLLYTCRRTATTAGWLGWLSVRTSTTKSSQL